MPALLALKFVLEVIALVAFALWGSGVGSGALPVLVAIAAPAVVAALWGRLAAPKSPQRLGDAARVPFELAVFALASLALLSAAGALPALLLGATAVATTVALR